MKQLDKPADLLQQLRTFDIFEGVDDAALQWLIDQSTYVMYPRDSMIFRNGEKVDHMQVMLRGGLRDPPR